MVCVATIIPITTKMISSLVLYILEGSHVNTFVLEDKTLKAEIAAVNIFLCSCVFVESLVIMRERYHFKEVLLPMFS